MAPASNTRPEWPRRTGARPGSRSRSTSAAARSPPRGRGRQTSPATRSASTWCPAARSTSSKTKRALSARLSAPPLFTFRLATLALVTRILCIRGGAPRPSPCLATTRYLPSRRWPRPPPTPVTIPRTQETRKRESRIRGVSPGVLSVYM